jgi:hypothetical protein
METSLRFRFHIRDLFVLTLVVALLLGFMLPAVNAAREAARRTQCSNNLKQLGLSVHNYSDTYRRLPAGTIANRKLQPVHRFSWVVAIIPFIDQISFFILADEAWDAPQNLPPKTRHRPEGWDDLNPSYQRLHCNDPNAWVDTPMPYLPVAMCPSKELPDVRGLSATAYVGPAGLGPDAAVRSFGHPLNGMWGYDRQTTLSQVTDGLSQTSLFIETTSDNGPWTAGGPPTVRGYLEESKPLGVSRPFGGFHLGGCQIARGDASTEFIRNDIDPQVFARYFTIAEEVQQSAAHRSGGVPPPRF